jgi:hypothetical protein
VTEDRFGQLRATRDGIERDARAAMLSAFKQLNLSVSHCMWRRAGRSAPDYADNRKPLQRRRRALPDAETLWMAGKFVEAFARDPLVDSSITTTS